MKADVLKNEKQVDQQEVTKQEAGGKAQRKGPLEAEKVLEVNQEITLPNGLKIKIDTSKMIGKAKIDQQPAEKEAAPQKVEKPPKEGEQDDEYYDYYDEEDDQAKVAKTKENLNQVEQ